MNAIDFTPLHRNTVGFDGLFNLLDTAMQQSTSASSGYPPYDIESVEDDKYRITLAVAGFAKNDLDIQIEKGVLTISGKRDDESQNGYLHNGIAKRSFQRKFQLADHVEVVDADLVNGLLQVSLVKEIPDAMKPKKIAIGQNEELTEPVEKNQRTKSVSDSLAAA